MRSIALLLVLMLVVQFGYSRSVYEVNGNNIVINLDAFGVKSNLLKIELWNESTVRVISTMNDEFNDDSDTIWKRGTDEVKFKVAYAQSNIEITTSKLFISIEEKGIVRLFNREGRKMMVESDRTFSPVEGEEGKFSIEQHFFLNRNEHIYGLGHSNEKIRFNLRENSFDFVQDEVSVAMPVMMSDKGYAFIWDNYSATRMNDTPASFSIASDFESEISYFFIADSNWDNLLEQVQAISGTATLLPYNAYGLTLSDANEARKTIDMLQSKNIKSEMALLNNDFLNQEQALYAESKNQKEKQNVAAYLKLRENYQGFIDQNSETRPLIATHINFPGIQQYNTVSLAGKVTGSWEALKSQVAAGITASFSGQPHWATTIGGVSAPSANAEELFTRWYQFAAFTPVVQLAPFDKNGYNIETGNEYFEAITEALSLRLKLMPYLYASAADAVLNHKTIMRSLLFDYLEGKGLNEISDQYLLGTSLMVCPVVESGATQRVVVLPEGNNWYNFFTGEKSEGGTTIQANAGIGDIPLFVKEGAIVPIVVDDEENTFEIRVYGGADGAFTFYDDEKDGNAYKNEGYSTISFEYSEKRKTLSFGSLSGEFDGMPEKYTFRIVNVDEKNGIGNSLSKEYEVINYDGKRSKVKL